ncbi:hypothetical protein GmRootA79_19920 [Acidovorax sp. A79]|uniref:DUF3592 domain-containing protein n=1 Tax=Acidovorax sp. A79 TaxID=3056107 RepID=UPI0034E8A1B6
MNTSTFRGLLGFLGWFLLVPGALTALGAAWLLASGMSLLGGTLTAQGRVVAHEETFVGPSHRKVLARKSIVEFVAGDGRTLRFTDSVARQLQAVHKVGEAVTVRYPAKDPAQAEISSSTTIRSFIGVVMLLFGAVGMAAGWLLLRLRPRAAAPPP